MILKKQEKLMEMDISLNATSGRALVLGLTQVLWGAKRAGSSGVNG